MLEDSWSGDLRSLPGLKAAYQWARSRCRPALLRSRAWQEILLPWTRQYRNGIQMRARSGRLCLAPHLLTASLAFGGPLRWVKLPNHGLGQPSSPSGGVLWHVGHRMLPDLLPKESIVFHTQRKQFCAVTFWQVAQRLGACALLCELKLNCRSSVGRCPSVRQLLLHRSIGSSHLQRMRMQEQRSWRQLLRSCERPNGAPTLVLVHHRLAHQPAPPSLHTDG